MTTKIKAIDHINMTVKNLRESIDWYEKVFGLEVKEEGRSNSGNDYAIVGETGSIMLAIYQLEQGKTLKIDEQSHDGINHFGVEVEDFDQALINFKQHGVKINYNEAIFDYEKSRSFYITDPSGYEIEVAEVFGGGL